MLVFGFNVLDYFLSQHQPTFPACTILNFTATFWLSINCYTHWKTNVDTIADMSIPSWYGLVSTYPFTGYKLSFQCWLKISTISFINIYQCSACDTSCGLSFGWVLHLKALQRSSNLCLGIPVMAPSFTAGMYLLCETVDHNHALNIVSNLVINIMIPNNL